jgi:hypothetical protein
MPWKVVEQKIGRAGGLKQSVESMLPSVSP